MIHQQLHETGSGQGLGPVVRQEPDADLELIAPFCIHAGRRADQALHFLELLVQRLGGGAIAERSDHAFAVDDHRNGQILDLSSLR